MHFACLLTSFLTSLGESGGGGFMIRVLASSLFFYKHVKGQLAPPWVTVKFLDQRRSLGAPVSDFTFFHRRGHKTLPEMQNFSCRKDSDGPSNVRGDTSRCQGRWHLHGLIPIFCSLFVNMFCGNVSRLQPHMEFVTRVTSRARVKYFCLKGLALKKVGISVILNLSLLLSVYLCLYLSVSTSDKCPISWIFR